MSPSRRAPTAREDFIATYFAHDDQVTKGMVNDYLDRIEAESPQVTEKEARIAALKDGLRRYGGHTNHYGPDGWWKCVGRPTCTCGYAALLPADKHL